MILNSMVDDKDNVLPVNFPAVSSILLEFVIALSDYMGWSSMITGALQKKEVRFYNKIKGNARGGYLLTSDNGPSDLNETHQCLKHLKHIWTRFLSFIDNDCTNSEQLLPEYDIDKVASFAKSFFDKVEKSRYIFFVEEDTDFTSHLRNP